MRDDHLQNTIAMLQRNGQTDQWAYTYLLTERMVRIARGSWAPGFVGKVKRAQGARHGFTEGRVSFREVDFTGLERSIASMYERDRNSRP